MNMFSKSIPLETITKSISLLLIAVSTIGIVLFLILLGEVGSVHAEMTRQRQFLAYLFETVSAFWYCGLIDGHHTGVVGLGKVLDSSLDVYRQSRSDDIFLHHRRKRSNNWS